MSNSKKPLIAAMAVALVAALGIGGTIAWLTDETDDVNNTFTVGNIDIDLTETTGATYKMVPGNAVDKDPVVTVEKGSEACWVFVRIDKNASVDEFLTYAIADGWELLTDDENGDGTKNDAVYYRAQDALTGEGAASATYSVLKDDQVEVKPSVTKEMMDGLTEDTLPILAFKAYAVQKENIADAATAWAKISA